MRRVVIIIVALALFSACADNTVQRESLDDEFHAMKITEIARKCFKKSKKSWIFNSFRIFAINKASLYFLV